jgi:hypothetical protein
MNEYDGKEFADKIEYAIDNKLKKWKKYNSIVDKKSTQMEWQFEQTRFALHIFPNDEEEMVILQFFNPIHCARWTWSGLNDKTINKIIDRMGNLAQTTMYPPRDYGDE